MCVLSRHFWCCLRSIQSSLCSSENGLLACVPVLCPALYGSRSNCITIVSMLHLAAVWPHANVLPCMCVCVFVRCIHVYVIHMRSSCFATVYPSPYLSPPPLHTMCVCYVCVYGGVFISLQANFWHLLAHTIAAELRTAILYTPLSTTSHTSSMCTCCVRACCYLVRDACSVGSVWKLHVTC